MKKIGVGDPRHSSTNTRTTPSYELAQRIIQAGRPGKDVGKLEDRIIDLMSRWGGGAEELSAKIISGLDDAECVMFLEFVDCILKHQDRAADFQAVSAQVGERVPWLWED